jgi:hypothetical protein
MGLFSFLRREQSQPLRAYVATKRENLAAERRRNDKRLELAVYIVNTTPEQRKAETEDYFRRAREPGFEKAVRLGAWDGLKGVSRDGPGKA